jgi:hypothetical protein
MSALAAAALSGVVFFVIGRWAWYFVEYGLIRRRLLRALVFEAVSTLRKFDSINLDTRVKMPGPQDDLKVLRSLNSGVVLDPPLNEAKQLIVMLDGDNARLVIKFFDRWSRFFAFEQRYSDAYEKLLVVIADSDDKPKRYERLREEYWEQVLGINGDVKSRLRTSPHFL